MASEATSSMRITMPFLSVSGAILVGTLVLSGCMSSNTLRPLPPVPTTSVTSSALPAPITIGQEPTIQSQSLDETGATDPNAPLVEPVESAALDATTLPTSTDGGEPVTEDDLIGVWSANTPAATCSLNLSLTSWQGGFRASTRNCADVQVATLTAWALEGNQVLLRGTDGATLARLFRTGPTRYAGQMETGQAITLFR